MNLSMSPARAQPDVLDFLAALGPFFAVEAHRPGADPAPPWRPLGELIRQPGLEQRISVVRDALAAQAGVPASGIDVRAAASVTQLGLVARVVAPALAAQAGQRPLDLRLPGLWWQDGPGGPLPLAVPGPAAESIAAITAGTSDLASDLVDEVIAPITRTTAALVPVSPRVLWGNVASAVNGAASQVARTRPDLAPAAWATAAAYFRHPRLNSEPGPPGPSFRRSSCCLIYRLEPGPAVAVCGDCILGDRRR
jgi:hypothetical protein